MRLITALVLACASIQAEAAILDEGGRAPQVKIEGTTIDGLLQDGVRKYLGIPYGQAPSGKELRWQVAELASLPETFSALQHGNACHQMIQPKGDFELAAKSVRRPEDENCLNLSVYVPDGELSVHGSLPVVIYVNNDFHAGGSTCMAANEPSSLVRSQRVIVITFNARLGPFGYLFIPDSKGPSTNYGLHDALLVLEWVHKYIAAFGGDAQNITLQGVSSGSFDVMLMLNALGQKEMKERFGERPIARAIISSFSQTNVLCLNRNRGSKIFYTVAKAVGCPTLNTERAYECLLQRPASRIQEAVRRIGWERSWSPVYDEVFVVKDSIPVGEAWLKVPTVFTEVADEGSILVDPTILDSSSPAKEKYKQILQSFKPPKKCAQCRNDTAKELLQLGLLKKVKQLYPITGSEDSELWRPIGDAMFRMPIYLNFNMFAQQGVVTTYHRFGWEDSANAHFNPPFESVQKLGAFSSSEYLLLFDFTHSTRQPLPREHVSRLQRLFGSYYRMGFWAGGIDGAPIARDKRLFFNIGLDDATLERLRFWLRLGGIPLDLERHRLRMKPHPRVDDQALLLAILNCVVNEPQAAGSSNAGEDCVIS